MFTKPEGQRFECRQHQHQVRTEMARSHFPYEKMKLKQILVFR